MVLLSSVWKLKSLWLLSGFDLDTNCNEKREDNKKYISKEKIKFHCYSIESGEIREIQTWTILSEKGTMSETEQKTWQPSKQRWTCKHIWGSM